MLWTNVRFDCLIRDFFTDFRKWKDKLYFSILGGIYFGALLHEEDVRYLKTNYGINLRTCRTLIILNDYNLDLDGVSVHHL